MEAKIKVMSLEQLEKARVLISMTADIDKERKEYLYKLIDAREDKLSIGVKVISSEILPGELD